MCLCKSVIVGSIDLVLDLEKKNMNGVRRGSTEEGKIIFLY
jgi:hypothetical protein